LCDFGDERLQNAVPCLARAQFWRSQNSRNFFGFFLCNITKITRNECFPGLSGKYAAAGNRLIDFDL